MEQVFEEPAQREIWAVVRALNEAWTRGDPAALTDYFHPGMVAITPMDRLRREGAAACIAGWQGFAKAARIDRWEESDPLIRVYGDAAVVSYYYAIDFEMGGKRYKEGGRDLFFLVRENGCWWAVADQFSSFPSD